MNLQSGGQTRIRYRLLALIGLIAALVLAASGRPAAAAALPDGYSESLVAGGLENATAMAFAPDGRLFILQQAGQVRVVKNGSLLETPFLTLNIVRLGERGLLGIAFDPDFATNHFLYLYYTTNETTPRNRISRFTAAGDVVSPDSETVILNLDPLSTARNHNGGSLHFGPDGKLYVATGENATPANSQTMDNLLGKILRINKDGTIPSDNPFYASASGKNRAIWALGLRNPFTFAFRPTDGRLHINDVGYDSWEEINEGIAGANYGWPNCEGVCATPAYTNPIYTYPHSDTACAITGGVFYDPATGGFPADFAGDYFFADYCGGWIKRFDPADQSVTDFASGISQPVDLDVGPDGALYYLARGSRSVYKIEAVSDQPPVINSHPAGQTASVGQSVTFEVQVSGSAPLAYQWQRDGDDIPGATAAAYTLPSVSQADDGARFRVVVSNAFGDDTSDEATLTVVENLPPVGVITKPLAGLLYSGGETIRYAATGTDHEDGALPARAFTWRVDFHHDTHFHPFLPDKTGRKSGSFTVPRTGETAADVWYRIHLTVRDADGAEHSSYVDVLPRTVLLTLTTVPAGLGVTLNGQPVSTPYTFESVVGIRHVISAPTPQVLVSTEYRFRKWSDGKAQTHAIIAPALARTYTATFRSVNN